MDTLNEKTLLIAGLLIVLAFSLFSFVQAGQDNTSDGKSLKGIVGASGVVYVAGAVAYLWWYKKTHGNF